MKMFIFWLTSSIMCLTMEFINELQLFKYLADCGYLINIQRLSEFSNLNPDDKSDKKLLLSLIIPILNFATVFNRTQIINQSLPIIIEQFRVTDCIDEMTKEEKEEYQNHPTAFKALVLSVKRDMKNMPPTSNSKKDFDNDSEDKEKLEDNKSKEDIIGNDKNSFYRQQLNQYKKLLEREKDKLLEQKNDEKTNKVLKK